METPSECSPAMAGKLEFCLVGTLLVYQDGLTDFDPFLCFYFRCSTCLGFGHWAPLPIGSCIFWTRSHCLPSLAFRNSNLSSSALIFLHKNENNCLGLILKVGIIGLCAFNIFLKSHQVALQNTEPIYCSTCIVKCQAFLRSCWLLR